MSFKKRDLEIVYNLRWKNGPKREDKKQMSIVAVYDVPATTLNFQVFKSYLLKNSGTDEDDVRVSYIMDNGKEYPIKSQTDFQVALYAFRNKARVGEVINLLLERTADDQPIHKNLRHSNDVETQSDNMEQNSILTTCSNSEIPPEWFIAGLAQLKKDIKEEVTANVSNIVSNAVADLKTPIVSPPQQYALCPHHRIRGRYERRLKKITPHAAENVSDAKDLIKSLKLENKLDKLERKATKYREKRLALHHCQKSSDSEGQSSSRSRSRDKEEKRKWEEHQKRKAEEQQKQKGEEEQLMDARPVNVQTSVPHMLGGEIYMHQWEVQNVGQAQWTSRTQLQYTWGSKMLVPVEKTLSVPCLRPGEKGTVSARLQIPTQSGKFECYWQFMHKGRRFGHWLGVQVVVDSFDLKGHGSVLERSEPVDLLCDFYFPKEGYEQITDNSDTKTKSKKLLEKLKSLESQAATEKPSRTDKQAEKKVEQLVREVCDDFKALHLERKGSLGFLSADLEEIDSDCSWSSEPTHFWSKVEQKGEFVVVPVPQCFVLDTPESSDNNLSKSNGALPKQVPLKPVQVETAPGPPKVQVTASKQQKEKNDNFDDNNNTESGSGASAGGSIKLRDEDLDNIVVITVPKDEQVKEGFIYVHVDGQKVLIPKNILKTEVVTAAQELENSPSAANSVGVIIDSNESLNKSPTPSAASTITGPIPVRSETKKSDDNSGNTLDSPVPKTLEEPVIHRLSPFQDNVAVDLSTGSREVLEGPLDDGVDRSNYFEANNYMSHCSAAGSCYSEMNSQAERQNRVFVFPQDVPGYEIVYPVLDLNSLANPNLTTESFVPQQHPPPTAPCAPCSPFNVIPQHIPNPFVETVPNYQQTPLEMRRTPVYPPATDPLLYAPYQEPLPSAYLGGAACVDIQQPVYEGAPQQAQPTPQPQPPQQPQSPPQPQPTQQPQPSQPRTGGNRQESASSQVHILPETLVNGAMNVASSALDSARAAINAFIKPQPPGTWINGHWVSNNPETPREANLQALAEMGFWNRDLNATLLARFNDDLNRVVAELVQ